MCESNAYIVENGSESLIMESVNFLKPDGDKIHIKSIFGEEKTLEARIVELNLGAQKIILQAR